MMQRLHICIVGPADPAVLREHLAVDGPIPDGIGGVPLNQLTQALLKMGHRVSLVTHSPSIREVWRGAGSSLKIVMVPSRARARDRALDFFAVERRGISKELRQLRPDVVHAHWTYEFALGAIAADIAPVLVTAHDAPLTILRHLPDPYRLVRAVMAYRVRMSTRQLTAVAPYLAHQWRRQMFYRGPIAVIPNPVPDLLTVSERRDAQPRILSVADGSRLKNVRSLVRAFVLVRAQCPDAILRLVGPGLGVADNLALWAHDHELGEGVTFVGRLNRDQLADEYSRANVFCHTSLEESQGLVLLEALAAGLPVVAGSRSGGVPWTLFDGQAGRLVDVRNPTQIASALLDAIRDPSSTVASGFRVQTELRMRYSPEAIAMKYLAEYERVLRDYGKKESA